MLLVCDILTSLDNTLGSVLKMTWPMLFISIMLLATVRIAYLLKHKEEFILHRELLLLTFLLYVLCLFQIVTAQDINTMSGNNIIPFKEILRYKIGNRLFVKNVLGNIIMFVPYGFFASLYVGIKNWKHTFVLAFIASLSIEITQLVIGRSFDIDDVLLNVTGGLIGFFIYHYMDMLISKLPKVFKSELLLDIISVLSFIMMILYIIWRL